MKRFIYLSILLLTFCACSSSKNLLPITQPTERVVVHDTLRVKEQHYDSIYVFEAHEQDMLHDTVFVRDRAIEYRYKFRTDTLRSVVHDSVPYPVVVTEYKHIRHRRSIYEELSVAITTGLILWLAAHVMWKFWKPKLRNHR